jgi:hypothetical protein
MTAKPCFVIIDVDNYKILYDRYSNDFLKITKDFEATLLQKSSNEARMYNFQEKYNVLKN